MAESRALSQKSRERIALRAQLLLDAGFRVYGIGNFDLTADEIVSVFWAMLGNNPNDELEALYVEFSKRLD